MKIKHMAINNFRSIKRCKLVCRDMLVLLGQNNHGKSNIISALDFALSSSAKPNSNDIFDFAEQDDKSMWVEVTFDRLTEQESTTFNKYVRPDGTFRFRKTAKYDDEGKVVIAYNGYVSEPEEEWLKSDNANNYTRRAEVEETPLSTYVPESGRLSKAQIVDAQRLYIEEHRADLIFHEALEEGALLGQRNVAAGVLPEFFLVPAVRDLSDESKVKSTALFGKLLTFAVTEMASADPRFRIIQEQLGELIGVLNAGPGSKDRPQQLTDLESSIEQELSEWDVRVSVEVTPPDISKIFELGTDIHLDDGHKTLAERKGHGLQRAVIFGLMKAWAKAMRRAGEAEGGTTARKASESVVFAIEEPELFLHPHAQRALDTALRVLSNSENSQVLICSHSTHFVNLDDYRGIALIRKASAKQGTSVVQCTEDLFDGEGDSERKNRFHMATWVNPDRGEMLFARRVALVEGETEKSIFPFLAEKLGCHSVDVSVIDCGSKHNIPLYVAIANAFDLNYIVVHDEDPLPDPIPENWGEDKTRGKRRTFELNSVIQTAVGEAGSIVVLSPDFEGCSGVSHNQANKKGKALAALSYRQIWCTASWSCGLSAV
ncbi:MAG: AAA family ATPase, partial [Candidatus Poribacteria bacterium]|nr:AAA family ATPase [Candidatus Poribacteria bacterium]